MYVYSVKIPYLYLRKTGKTLHGFRELEHELCLHYIHS